MKHIEYATVTELEVLARCEQHRREAEAVRIQASAEKRAIAERCRARAKRHKEGKP